MVSTRRRPQQARSSDLVLAVLDAAVQVLTSEGAHRFTTARVAERAGVSVGSLYQYFPNKAAILFRLQADEWRETIEQLRTILENTVDPPLVRLRSLVHAFIRSECDEAPVRMALDDAAPLYRDAPEAAHVLEAGERIFEAFVREALPQQSHDTRLIAADLIRTTLSEVGSSFSAKPRIPSETAAFAEALADMLCAYLAMLERGRGESRS